MNARTILGAIIGDISGSTREGFRSSRFTLRQSLFSSHSSITDDTVLTIAVADWLMHRDTVSIRDSLMEWGRRFPHAGYGRGFRHFLSTGDSYRSTHNGAAMRVSPVGFMAGTEEECMALAVESASPTHDTREGTDGACAIALSVFMARNGKGKDQIRNEIESRFGYDLRKGVKYHREMNMAISEGRLPRPESIAEASVTVPQALESFLESDDYESAVRMALSTGGDTDTIACMAGAVASAFYGVPEHIANRVLVYLPAEMIQVINRMEGSSLKPTGITPPSAHRWGLEEYRVYACSRDESVLSRGFRDTVAGRFNPHPLKAYPIHLLEADAETVTAEVERLAAYALLHPNKRFHVENMGPEMAPQFGRVLEIPNILLPESYVAMLKEARMP